MQNFSTTLRNDLVNNQRIYLPAGQAKFTLTDVDDIGNVAAKIITEPQQHVNKSYELTNNETLTFAEMVAKLSEGLGKKIDYVSPNLLQFYFTKRRENMPTTFILVMIYAALFSEVSNNAANNAMGKSHHWTRIQIIRKLHWLK